jgi:peptide chain release factor 1
MFEQLNKIEKRFTEIETDIANPEISSDPDCLARLAKERAELEDIVINYRELKTTTKSITETRDMLNGETDEDMKSLAQDEIERLLIKKDILISDIKIALLPKDPNDARDVILEIRAGTGGDEAALFANDLFLMYTRYAQAKGWKADIININETSIGGIKEVIVEIKGDGAYSRLKYERGVHRVQRVPTTESSGRIHTSTATVAVLPEAEEVEVDINPDDLRIDIFHAGGAGGQNVNKVATAVRITHLPTNIVVTCQDERSQLKNKTKAMAVLRARLLDIERRRQESQIIEERRSQVGTGERSEKIRTYNFPQDRLTDHRIGLSMHNLPRLLEGYIDDLIDAIATKEQTRQLEAQRI